MSSDKYSEYLRFDASDIQTLLRRKLTESGIMTDQLYPGSDARIIIDLFSWTFNVLMYILNNNASDSLFSDTALYENMNRLVKLLGYNPIGFKTAQCQFKLSINESSITQLLPETINIPRFASIQLSKNDQYGNTVKYTFLDAYSFAVNSSYDSNGKIVANIITPNSWPTLYNGQMKKYKTIFYSTGIVNQLFQLSDLDPDNDANPDFCDCTSFYVFVETVSTETGESIYTQWHQVQNLILNAEATDTYYELRLNEDKKYILKFGDDIHGKVPENGASIHILYLKSNGSEGVLDTNEVNLSQIKLKINGFQNSLDMINMIYHGMTAFKQNYGSLFINNSIFNDTSQKITFNNIQESSQPSTFESVDSIRANAPTAFRSGQRLITNYDYKNYILSNFANLVNHIYVNNNNYYTSTFYRWLNKYNALNINIRKYYYKFANACDFNNIYLWIKSKNELSQLNMNKIVTQCEPYKSLTAELVPLAAIDTYFIPFVQHTNEEYQLEIDSSMSNLDDYLSRIKIIVYKNSVSIISNDQLKEKINNIILDYFNINNQDFGAIINLAQITKQIYALGYVKSIKTVNIPEQDENDVTYTVGLSFAKFTPKFINNQDFEIFTGSISLENFQFPNLYLTSLLNIIEIKDETHSLTNIEF